MKSLKYFLFAALILFAASCGQKDETIQKPLFQKQPETTRMILPLDKGFSEYITAYTSGIIPSNGIIEIQFTPEFSARADKQISSGLFVFDPVLKGKAEWKGDNTLVFTPSKLLDPGKIYSGELNLGRLADVEERLQVFPLRLQTLRKDFSIMNGTLECSAGEEDKYTLNGELIASDFIEQSEVEGYLTAKLENKKLDITWDHSDNFVHKFTVSGISRSGKSQTLTIEWNGTKAGVKQKGSKVINIPPVSEFSVLEIRVQPGENQKIDVVFSDPLDPAQELEGLIFTSPVSQLTISVNNNTASLFPAEAWYKTITLNVDQAVRNGKGKTLASSFAEDIDFIAVNPGIQLVGEGAILPSSQNLIFPFRAACLRAIDLRITKIFDNNLPYYFQQNYINTGYNIKRFGRPVYSGKVDLVTTGSTGTWNLYTIDLSDYIDIEPGVLYQVRLGMRKSYALLDCPVGEEERRYEEYLQRLEEKSEALWDNPDIYYEDTENEAYYSMDFRWDDRDDPCKAAYYSPDKTVTRNVLASNIGIIAKQGEDNILHIMTNDLLTALPLNEVFLDVYDYQLQVIASGKTNQDGSASIHCSRKPFLLIAKKDKDRNYLKLNDASSLSLSSFDVAGQKPENGIKAFIYGERDVWRPGDTIFLSVFIKDLKNDLPPDHPVQFELINPMEQRVDNQILKPMGRNLLVFRTKTPADAATGNYRAVVRIGGAAFTRRVRIETVKPNRLKINLSFPGNILGGQTRGATGTLSAKWLNGSVARNLRTSVDYILRHTKTEFEKYGQYIFDDPASEFYSESVNIFNSTIDENGNATIRFQPGEDLKAPGMLNAVFTAKVQETGGDESIIQATYKYAPYPVFVGINIPALKGKSRMIFTDADNEVKIVTVDEKGNPVRANVNVEVFKIDYRWWWESSDENLAYYISNRIYRPVLSKGITTGSAGEGTMTFRIDKNDWGRYLVRTSVRGGHSSGKILLIDWPWEYGMKGNAEGATLLAVSTDKEKYNPGDEVRLSFPSPENSRAIITLENATGVVQEMRVPSAKGVTEVRFRATPEMAPNIYAYVSVIQPHSQTINDMPVRLYGVVPVMVEDPETRISPQLTVANEVRSRQPFEIKVSEANRNAMTYTVAVVDEGLLDITGYKTPDPWSYFYAREALGVKTWDIYDHVLGAFGGTLDRIFAVGGDEALSDKTANKAQRFIPVVRFLGPFNLAAGKTNSHTITLPRYTGSVRTMVIAGNEKAYGTADKAVLVRDPLMVLVTAPRVISPGEKAALPVTLFIQKEGIREITIRAEGNDLIRFGESVKNITASEPGEKDSEFTFVAGDKTGAGRIKVTASGGGETAVYELEIEVRSPNPPETRAEMKVLQQGEKWVTSFKPFGIEGSNSAVLEVSGLPFVNLEKRLDYLLQYPHGCSEQITSAAFPQLYLKALTGNDENVIKTADLNIKKAIGILTSRQMVNGGIALWPGAYQADQWGTSYTGHFMLEAEKMGYNIPSGFRQKWIAYQKKSAQDWRYDRNYKFSSADQAYRLFTLALAGQPDKGAMNRLREITDLPVLSRWILAAAFATTGRPEAAETMLDIRNVETEQEYHHYYYGSRTRDKSIILYTLILLKKTEQAVPLLNDICNDLNRDEWLSTHSIAWGLFSYMKWAEAIPGDKNSPVRISVGFNGETSDQTVGGKQIWKKDLKIISGTNSLTVENNSDKPAYVTLIRKGVPLISDVTGAENGLALRAEYLDLDRRPIDQKQLVQGTDFMMVVKVTNTSFSRISNIALTQMVPSGWEIRNTRLFEADWGIKESVYDYRDIRDDRVNTYFSLGQAETKTFVLILNAAYRGEFSQPSLWCEAMYTENCYSRIPGTAVKVIGQ